MIVRHFLRWIETAPAGERADATSALARAWLWSDMEEGDRDAAEAAMVMLLDDPSPLVRRALAEALGSAAQAPHTVVLSLAFDQPDIACLVLERSPVLTEQDLVEALAGGVCEVQAAIARRADLSRALSAALAEVGSPTAVLVLIENPAADVARVTLSRIVERFGHLAPIREALLARSDIDAVLRQAIVQRLAGTLGRFAAARGWLRDDRAEVLTREACEKATVALAADAGHDELARFVAHLMASGQLTTGLLLRALLSGNVALFETALAGLSGLSPARVAGLLKDRNGSGLRALYERAGLPAFAFAATRSALDALAGTGFAGDPRGEAALRRRMVERVLTDCRATGGQDGARLVSLLSRFAAEAAREEARAWSVDFAEEEPLSEPDPAEEIAA
jgi:uncharacterized protein (DUF2336 family)